MATDTSTFSVEIEEGSSYMLGVRHRSVVLFMYVACEVPNLPNLHFNPYCSFNSPEADGIAIINKELNYKSLTYVARIHYLHQQ
jgi:hypothetical protein